MQEEKNGDVTLACLECWWMLGASREWLDMLDALR